jgi:hypothetical protein
MISGTATAARVIVHVIVLDFPKMELTVNLNEYCVGTNDGGNKCAGMVTVELFDDMCDAMDKTSGDSRVQLYDSGKTPPP